MKNLFNVVDYKYELIDRIYKEGGSTQITHKLETPTKIQANIRILDFQLHFYSYNTLLIPPQFPIILALNFGARQASRLVEYCVQCYILDFRTRILDATFIHDIVLDQSYPTTI